MSRRGEQLYADGARQITALSRGLGSLADPSRLNAPCPGREKLGDGSAGAVCAHVADVYGRIAGLALTGSARAPGHQRPGPGPDSASLIERLDAALNALNVLRTLDDAALGAVPQAGAFRFADGRRTLEQVLSGLLRHQGHQVDAVLLALSGAAEDYQPNPRRSPADCHGRPRW